MRNRRRTIESLRRLAERSGTPEEGETARRMLERIAGNIPIPKPFDASEFPRFTRIFYAYWCYMNDAGVIVGKSPKIIQGQTWIRIKFDRLKTVRAVPVTSDLGCHISKTPFSPADAHHLYSMGLDFASSEGR